VGGLKRGKSRERRMGVFTCNPGKRIRAKKQQEKP
jgi:hypothetical protein